MCFEYLTYIIPHNHVPFSEIKDMDLYNIDIIGPVRHPQPDSIHIDSTTTQSQNRLPISLSCRVCLCN